MLVLFFKWFNFYNELSSPHVDAPVNKPCSLYMYANLSYSGLLKLLALKKFMLILGGKCKLNLLHSLRLDTQKHMHTHPTHTYTHTIKNMQTHFHTNMYT